MSKITNLFCHKKKDSDITLSDTDSKFAHLDTKFTYLENKFDETKSFVVNINLTPNTNHEYDKP